jgi:hypothetical protein
LDHVDLALGVEAKIDSVDQRILDNNSISPGFCMSICKFFLGKAALLAVVGDLAALKKSETTAGVPGTDTQTAPIGQFGAR